MRKAQEALAGFLPLIDWPCFRRRNLHGEIELDTRVFYGFACGDAAQAVLWLLRRTQIGSDGRVKRDAPAIAVKVGIPGLQPGRYRITFWNTEEGRTVAAEEQVHESGPFVVATPACVTDVAIAVRRTE
jgi:mannan endo-1,4-beta-mannosidase